MTNPSGMSSLYVGDLHPDISEATIFEKFSPIGPLLTIRVCRDLVTRRSLGYAYVNFQQPADAERALDTLNYDLIKNRPIRIMWSQRDPLLRKSGIGNIFIKNLDKSIDHKSLHDTFSAFGTILSCKIMLDEDGVSRGFGFIQFETEEAVKKAIKNVNGMLMGDKKVYVGPFIPKNQRETLNGPIKYTNIFVKNFGTSWNEADFKKVLGEYGDINSAKIEIDQNGVSKGFGFCSFNNFESAAKAVEALNGMQVGEKQIFVGRFKSKAEREAEKKKLYEARRLDQLQKTQGVHLYVKNLDDSIDDAKLYESFSKFGNITGAKVMKKNDRSLGFGFVCFTAPDEATKAVTEMNGALVGSKPLYVALAQTRELRRAQLQQRFAQRHAPMYSAQMGPPYPTGMMPYGMPMVGQPDNRQQFLQPQIPYRAQPRWPQNTVNSYRPQSTTGPIGSSAHRAIVQNFNGRINTAPNPRPPVANPVYTTPPRNVPERNVNSMTSAIIVPGQEPLTLAALSSATPQQQKQMLGERLYPSVQQLQPDANVGKITGMLLELDNTEILHLLESREMLQAKVTEANAVLADHARKQLPAALATVNQSVNQEL